MRAIPEDAAFKEHWEEKKMHLAETAQERRDALASYQQPAQKKIMTDKEKKSAHDHGRLAGAIRVQAAATITALCHQLPHCMRRARQHCFDPHASGHLCPVERAGLIWQQQKNDITAAEGPQKVD